MRHYTKHVTFAVTNPRNVVARAVWVSVVGDSPILLAITKDDAIFSLQLCERVVVADVVSFGMRDRNAQHRACLQFISKRTVRRFHAHMDMFANKVQIAIANQSAGEKSRFAEDLESITNSEHEPATLGKLLN